MSNEGESENQVDPSQAQSQQAEISHRGTQESIPVSQERPLIATAPISAIFPVFNDAASLEKSLAEWTKTLDELNRDYEILLVEDSGTDAPASLAAKLNGARIRLLGHETRRGLGAALRTGLEAARFPLLLISTCDGRYLPADLQRFLKWIDKVDMVCGYRARQAGAYRPSWADRVYRWIARSVFALRLKDPECLYLLARRSIFARIPIQTDGPLGLTEVLAKANFLGCLMHETGVSYVPKPEAEMNWSNTSLRDKLAGLRHVFSKPDFGPATLPAQDHSPSP